MTDLREWIEIRMAEMQNTDGAYCVPCKENVNCAACQQFIDVITDVLERHAPVTIGWSGATVCSRCRNEPARYGRAMYPCAVVEEIAVSLGVLDDDD